MLQDSEIYSRRSLTLQQDYYEKFGASHDQTVGCVLGRVRTRGKVGM
jgi:hypothetical protein